MLSCSYTCWTWNNAAVIYLYAKLHIKSTDMIEKIIARLTETYNVDSSHLLQAKERRSRLASYVKIVEVHYIPVSSYDAPSYARKAMSYNEYLKSLSAVCQ